MSDRRRRRRQDVLWRRSLDAVLLLPPGAKEPVTLAGTGPDVWELLEAPASVAELTRELAARYEADQDVVGADVAELLQRLTELGLVEPTA